MSSLRYSKETCVRDILKFLIYFKNKKKNCNYTGFYSFIKIGLKHNLILFSAFADLKTLVETYPRKWIHWLFSFLSFFIIWDFTFQFKFELRRLWLPRTRSIDLLKSPKRPENTSLIKLLQFSPAERRNKKN